ncbi:hypothetical protein SAMN04487819_1089 [Actinopolyspora alba]|uniref:Uncharacterized protein n=1 Tax=Actinopolyspora alba TaxID=673379 RepID=A0A1I1XWH4_9ACTN|nr:hypothetical protein SAMN04487819_1089 [Actinopolyspora alba]
MWPQRNDIKVWHRDYSRHADSFDTYGHILSCIDIHTYSCFRRERL